MTALAVVENPTEIARYLANTGQATVHPRAQAPPDLAIAPPLRRAMARPQAPPSDTLARCPPKAEDPAHQHPSGHLDAQKRPKEPRCRGGTPAVCAGLTPPGALRVSPMRKCVVPKGAPRHRLQTLRVKGDPADEKPRQPHTRTP